MKYLLLAYVVISVVFFLGYVVMDEFHLIMAGILTSVIGAVIWFWDKEGY